MITDIAIYRAYAAEAERRAWSAPSGVILIRYQDFAAWWSAIADALEAGETDEAEALLGNVIRMKPLPLAGAPLLHTSLKSPDNDDAS